MGLQWPAMLEASLAGGPSIFFHRWLPLRLERPTAPNRPVSGRALTTPAQLDQPLADEEFTKCAICLYIDCTSMDMDQADHLSTAQDPLMHVCNQAISRCCGGCCAILPITNSRSD
jgi:hypothetical protein